MKMHSSQLEEVGFGFSSFVDVENIPNLTDTNEENTNGKTFEEAKAVLGSRKIREAKLMLRENSWHFTDKIRSQLWPALCQRLGKEQPNDTFYGDTVMLLFGTKELPNRSLILPQFVEPSHCHNYYLSREGHITAERVISVLGYSCPDVTYSPVAFPLAALFLHYMTEDTAYAAMANVLSCRSPVFITQTKLHNEITWQTCLLLAKKFTKNSIISLQKQFGGNHSELELLFSDWLWWIFNGIPFQHLVRVTDCFLMEGIKVLYRVALALAQLFSKLGSNPGTEWEEQFVHGNYSGAMMTFCRNLPVTPSKLLKLAFGIRNFSSASMAKMQLRTELMVKSRNTASVTSGPNLLKRARSSENLPSVQSQGEVRMASHTLTIKELLTVWTWLPIRITMYQPVLLYTTEEHGCSLTTFFVRVEKHEPTILIIKTCSGDIFGAYCSARWEERNLKDDKGVRQAYFGTGETFVFTLSPERRKYQWVGLDIGRNDDFDENGKGDIKHSSELFMAADNHMITIGGGGGSAIWMDENIRFGKSGHCETFNNLPLCPKGDFEIQVLEVYGFVGL
ncbi:GTPase-activating protein skywalker isoform X2 [Neocloeon triangulifer]|uniref:GTPase-activating protein skywalker isoform X2 n=1 Tax=Neocloeon triangulifer TaxID=2078957 RepID=UPI00286EEE08|nr:GTPase-activating protein skywalker isoform X2 [Neocloeon triangulifer]